MTQDAQQLDHRLVDYLYGELDQAERQRLEGELGGQPELRARLERWQQVRTAFAATSATDDGAPAIAARVLDAAHQRSTRRWRGARTGTRGWLLLPWALPAAASVLVVAGVTMHVLRRDRGNTGDVEESGSRTSVELKEAPQPGSVRTTTHSSPSASTSVHEYLRAVEADEAPTRGRGEKSAQRTAAHRAARDQWVDRRLLGRGAQDREWGNNPEMLAGTGARAVGDGPIAASSAPSRARRSTRALAPPSVAAAPPAGPSPARSRAAPPSALGGGAGADGVALARADRPYAEEEPPAAAADDDLDTARGEGRAAPSEAVDEGAGSAAPAPSSAQAPRLYAEPPRQRRATSGSITAVNDSAECARRLASAELRLRASRSRDRPAIGSRLIRSLGGPTLDGCDSDLLHQRRRYPLLFAAWRATL